MVQIIGTEDLAIVNPLKQSSILTNRVGSVLKSRKFFFKNH